MRHCIQSQAIMAHQNFPDNQYNMYFMTYTYIYIKKSVGSTIFWKAKTFPFMVIVLPKIYITFQINHYTLVDHWVINVYHPNEITSPQSKKHTQLPFMLTLMALSTSHETINRRSHETINRRSIDKPQKLPTGLLNTAPS